MNRIKHRSHSVPIAFIYLCVHFYMPYVPMWFKSLLPKVKPLRFRLPFVNCQLLVCLLVITCFTSQAQDFKQALLNMQKEYGAAGRMHIVMSIKGYETKTSATPFYNQRAEIKKEDDRYFYQFDNNDLLLNQKYLLMIDHQAKQIVCNRNTLKTSGLQDPFKMNLDSLLTAFGKSAYLGKKGDTHHYRITHGKGMIQQTDMYFDNNAHVLKKIEYSYEGGQWVVIHFELFDKQPTFEVDTFDEVRYMRWENGKLKPAQAFQQYEIIDVENNN